MSYVRASMMYNNQDSNHNNSNKNRNNNNNVNNFNPNNSRRTVEKKDYLRSKSIIEHKKIMSIFDNHFNNDVKDLFTFDDILTLRINRDRVGFSIYFYRYFPDSFDYFNDPEEGIRRISKVLPIFSKLAVFISNQSVWGKSGKYVKLDITWTNSSYDVKESGIDSLQTMLIALKSLEFDLDQLQVFECDIYTRLLGNDWCIHRIKRTWQGTSTYKYIMNNAFINPKFMKTRDFKDDITAIKVQKALKIQYPSINIQVVRLGSMKLQYLPTRLLITTSRKLDEKKLHQDYRRINGQRVTWERFNDKKKPKKEFHLLSNAEKLNEFKSLKISVGKHKGFEYVDNNTKNKNKINIIKDSDYNTLTAFWRTTMDQTSLSTDIYKKLCEIYDGNDGSAWCAQLDEKSDDKFHNYAESMYNYQKNKILNNNIDSNINEESKEDNNEFVMEEDSTDNDKNKKIELNSGEDVDILTIPETQSQFSFGLNNGNRNKNSNNNEINNQFKF